MPPKQAKRPKAAKRGDGLLAMDRAMAALSVGMALNFLPLRRTVVQNYVQTLDNFNTSATINTFGTGLTFLLNSAFAPGTGASAHQPYGFDTLATQYQRYKVHAVDWFIEVSVPVGAADTYLIAAKLEQPGTAYTIGGSTINVALEKPQVWGAAVVPGSSNATARLHGKLTMPQALGLSKQEYDANVEDYAALVSASPTRTLSLELAATNTNAGTAVSLRGQIRLRMVVEYFQPFVLAQS